MMKSLLIILMMFFSATVLAQDWRDSLEVARDAYKNENYKKAFRYYKSAQKNAPDYVDLSDEMAQSAYKSGDYETAEKIYQQSQSGKKSAKEKANNYHNLGNARMKNKDYQGAVDAYKESLRNNPDDEQTRYNLSEALRKLKKQQKQQKQQGSGGDNNQNQNQDQNQGNQNQGDQQNNGQQQNNNQQGNQGNKQKNGNDKQGGGDRKNEGQLPNKTIDRMLDELMKKEAETKRRMAGGGSGGFNPKSGKDW